MSLTLAEVIVAVESLFAKDREQLYDLLRCQQIEQIEAEILENRGLEQAMAYNERDYKSTTVEDKGSH